MYEMRIWDWYERNWPLMMYSVFAHTKTVFTHTTTLVIPICILCLEEYKLV